MEETWHVSVYWQQGNYELWANCSMCFNQDLHTGVSIKTTPPPAIMPGFLTTRSWPVRQKKRAGTSRKVLHTRQNNEPSLSRNNSPLTCLHLALAYRYHFVWRKYGNMYPCTNCFMCWNANLNMGLGVSRQWQLQELRMRNVDNIACKPRSIIKTGVAWNTPSPPFGMQILVQKYHIPKMSGCVKISYID